MSDKLILAGDIGGTKSNLGLFHGDPGAPELLLERSYQNRDYASLTELVALNPGRARPAAAQALIAAGTGLGTALLVKDRLGIQVLASEGGHADFAPRNEDEVALWRFLTARHGHVSVERVVSGPGLVNIFESLRNSGWDVPEWLSRRLVRTPDRAAVIAQAATPGEAAICAQALKLFLAAYGAAAGNLALIALATGGVYLGAASRPSSLRPCPPAISWRPSSTKGAFPSCSRTSRSR